MKKTLIALAVAAVAATSANATVIYQKDGTKIDLDGRAHFEIRNDKNNRTDLRDVGSRVRVRAYQDIGAGFTFYGGAELRFSKDNGDADSIGKDFRTHRLYAGIIHKDIGTLTFGRQLHLGDHIPKAHYNYEWGGNVLFDAHKKAAHFMSAKFAGFRFAADYYFGQANKDKSAGSTGWDEGQGYGVGLFYDGKFGDVAVRFGSGYSEVLQSPKFKVYYANAAGEEKSVDVTSSSKADEFKLRRAAVGFDITYGIVTVGFDWAHGKVKKDKVGSGNIGFQKITGGGGFEYNKLNRFQLGLKVQATEKNAIYAQYYFGKGTPVIAESAATTEAGAKASYTRDYGDDVKMRGWMIGADHKFNKQVAVYVEGGQGELKQDGEKILKNHRVLVGARILF